jgi:hypothetical protein
VDWNQSSDWEIRFTAFKNKSVFAMLQPFLARDRGRGCRSRLRDQRRRIDRRHVDLANSRSAQVLDASVCESSPRGSALFSGFSAMGIAGWVTLTGSDPAMLSSRPCSSFCSFGLRFRLIFEGTWESAPRFFVAG